MVDATIINKENTTFEKEKEGGREDLVPENDRLKLQLLNVLVDRARITLDNAKIRMENARLSIALSQRDLDISNSDLIKFGQDLAEKYRFNLQTDSVDWTTGNIKRGEEKDYE